MAPRTEERKKRKEKEKVIGKLLNSGDDTKGRTDGRPREKLSRPDSIRSNDDGESAEKLAGSIRELTWGRYRDPPSPRKMGDWPPTPKGLKKVHFRLKECVAKSAESQQESGVGKENASRVSPNAEVTERAGGRARERKCLRGPFEMCILPFVPSGDT